MVLIATSFLVSGSAGCTNFPWYTIPNAPTEEYKVQMELHTQGFVKPVIAIMYELHSG